MFAILLAACLTSQVYAVPAPAVEFWPMLPPQSRNVRAYLWSAENWCIACPPAVSVTRSLWSEGWPANIVEYDSYPALAQTWRITQLPTMQFVDVSTGVEVGRLVGPANIQGQPVRNFFRQLGVYPGPRMSMPVVAPVVSQTFASGYPQSFGPPMMRYGIGMEAGMAPRAASTGSCAPGWTCSPQGCFRSN